MTTPKKTKYYHEIDEQEDVEEDIFRQDFDEVEEQFTDAIGFRNKSARKGGLKSDGDSEDTTDLDEDSDLANIKSKGFLSDAEEDLDHNDHDIVHRVPKEEITLGSGDGKEIPITPFNLNEEREQGRYDAEGNFEWNPASESDELPELDTSNSYGIVDTALRMHNARSSKQQRLDALVKSEKDWQEFQEKVGLKGILKELLSLLEGNETPIQALKRLAPKKLGPVRRYVKPAEREESQAVISDKNKVDLEKITELCSNALALGMTGWTNSLII